MKTPLIRENAQSLVEYALIIALVAVILVSGLTTLQGGMSTAMSAVVAVL